MAFGLLGVFVWVLALSGYSALATPKDRSAFSSSPQSDPLRSWVREYKLHALLRNSLLPPTRVVKLPVEASFKPFLARLQETFFEVKSLREFDDPETSRSYLADFLYVHPCGVGINIEIDEPYGSDNLPRHGSDCPQDELRDEFFCSNNWIVIRFAEEQIVRYPLGCCRVIAQILYQTTGDRRFLTQLETVRELPLIPRWTTQQAEAMARQKVRQNYLTKLGRSLCLI